MNLERLEALLGKFFEGQVPDSLSEKLLTLKSLNEIQQLLGSSMDEIQGEARERSREDTHGTKGEMGSPDHSPEGQGDSLTNHPHRSGGEGTQGEAEEGPDQMDSSLAGRGEDSQVNTSPRDIKSSRNTPVKDRGFAGPGKRYRLFVRALPMVEKAQVKPEDLIRSYRREMEEVLTNDKIPLNYREFIKNYFLAIGAERESGKDE